MILDRKQNKGEIVEHPALLRQAPPQRDPADMGYRDSAGLKRLI
jgi:hypothetical protein